MAKVDVRVAGKTVWSGEVQAPEFKLENGVVKGGGVVGPKKEGV
jgi:hypothetical protein